MMSERQPFLTTREQDRRGAATQEGARTAPHVSRRPPPPRWSARRRRDGWFLLGVLLLAMVTILVLANTVPSQRGQATTRDGSGWERWGAMRSRYLTSGPETSRRLLRHMVVMASWAFR